MITEKVVCRSCGKVFTVFRLFTGDQCGECMPSIFNVVCRLERTWIEPFRGRETGILPDCYSCGGMIEEGQEARFEKVTILERRDGKGKLSKIAVSHVDCEV